MIKKIFFPLSISLLLIAPFLMGYNNKKTYFEIRSKCNSEVVLSYLLTMTLQGQRLIMGDTIFLCDDYSLEPLHDIQNGDIVVLDSTSKTIQNASKSDVEVYPSAYYLTAINQKVGMAFDTNVVPNVTRVYTSNNKQLGYGFSDEPFLKSNKDLLDDLKKEKDTIINNQHCTIFLCTKDIATTANNHPDILKRTKIIINNEQQEFCYSFISKKICERFRGSVVYIESYYASGLHSTMQYSYKKGFTPREKVSMDKYINLYNANLHLLDTLKTRAEKRGL